MAQPPPRAQLPHELRDAADYRGNHVQAGPSSCAAVNLGADYTPDETDFLRAIDAYKRRRQRPHPTWREVLAVLMSRGWRRTEEPTDLP